MKEDIYLSHDLRTYDPYDIWKTRIGLLIKRIYNKSKILGGGPALIFTFFDLYINNKFRWGYKRQEYPIVRGMAAQILLSKYKETGNRAYLTSALVHLEWLKSNSSQGFAGYCWGLGFEWPAGNKIIYDKNTPHSTHTPYVLEAYHLFYTLTGDNRYIDIIKSCYNFFEKDIKVMQESDQYLATSYGPFKDRIATNAVSYVMYSFAILSNYFPEKKEEIITKVKKLYNFIAFKQRNDGSWLYSPEEKSTFIDCFHTCFILKNIIKTNEIISLVESDIIINRGIDYLFANFYDPSSGLFKRFSISNKISLVKFDLYDNAEMLSLLKLRDNNIRALQLLEAIQKAFVRSDGIYSTVDRFNLRLNRNFLRWAVMPYFLALSSPNK